MGFQTRIFNYPLGTEIHIPDGLELLPRRWSGNAATGDRNCFIDISGEPYAIWQIYNFLGEQIEILNPHGLCIWRGRIWSTVVDAGGVSLGYAMDDMFNRVRAIYLEEDAAGEPVRQTTDWAEDVASIAAFGEFEIQISEGDSTQAAAEGARDQELSQGSSLTEILSVGTGTTISGKIECRGWYGEFDQKYYTQPSGRMVYESAITGVQALGVGATDVGTFVFAEPNEIRDIGGFLAAFTEDMQLSISGTTLNDGYWQVARGTQDAPILYTGPNLYFENPDNIIDDDSGIGFLEDATMLIIVGSASNDGVYGMEQFNGANWVEVSPDTIVDESGGGYYVCRANEIEVYPATITEELLPGPVTILTDTLAVSQSFLFDSDSDWTLNDISIQIGKVGNPTDNVVVDLRRHNVALDIPGIIFATAVAVAGSEISTIEEWVKFSFDNTYTLEVGERYWITVFRDGAMSTSDYYQIGVVDEDDGRFAGGEMKTWNGATSTLPSSWLLKDADMPFRIGGAWETTQQITEIVAQCGQYVTGVEIPDSSGIETPQYRDGDDTGYTEITDLMDSGFDDGSRMLIRVTDGAKLHVYKDDSDETDPRYALKLSGQLEHATGDPVAEGILPVAEYVSIPESPIPFGTALNPFYVESAEYNANTGRYVLRPKGSTSPWSAGSVLPG